MTLRRHRSSHTVVKTPLVVVALLTLLVVGCAGTSVEPEVEPEPQLGSTQVDVLPPYAAKTGDTLETVAAKFGIPFMALAERNDLKSPFEIKKGQVLSLNVPDLTAEKRSEIMTVLLGRKASVDPAFLPPADALNSPIPKPAPEPVAPVRTDILDLDGRGAPGGVWAWPASGPLVGAFDSEENRGIDIEAEVGAKLRAAADGVVQNVYRDVPTYGTLVVIQHGARFLGFYGCSQQVDVEVGDRVIQGDIISEVLGTEGESARIHFEIRKDAQPLDPLELLPPRS